MLFKIQSILARFKHQEPKSKYIFVFLLGFLGLAYCAGTEAYTIFINKKAFWLDEWFVLSSIKFKTYTDYFNQLDYGQHMPVAYISLIKLVSSNYDYSVWSLRIVPFLFQCLNIILSLLLAWTLFRNKSRSLFYITIFFLFFLTYDETFIYFTQVKLYSLDLFCVLIGTIQAIKTRNRCQAKESQTPWKPWLNRAFFVFLPSLSHLYLIVLAPAFLLLLPKLHLRKHQFGLCRSQWKDIVAIGFGTVIGLYFNIFPLLGNSNIRNYKLKHVVSYESFTTLFHSLKEFLIVLGGLLYPSCWFSSADVHLVYILLFYAGLGFCIFNLLSSRYKFFKSFLSDDEAIFMSKYVLLMVVMTTFLWAFKIVPVRGITSRALVFLFPTLAYCTIIALFHIGNGSGVRNILYGIAISLVLCLELISLKCYANDTLGEYTKFNQIVYDRIGIALRKAEENNASLFISENFYPYHQCLVVKTHPEFVKNNEVPIFFYTNSTVKTCKGFALRSCERDESFTHKRKVTLLPNNYSIKLLHIK